MKLHTLLVTLLILLLFTSCQKNVLPVIDPVEEVEYLSEDEAKELPHTGLPVVIINSPGILAERDKTIWHEATITIVNPDRSIDLRTTMMMKGRGNSSWDHFPKNKKSYSLKLTEKAKVLGMHSDRRWCIVSTWMDRTLIRNAITFEVARGCTSLKWTPSGKFVEVVLNGTHQGNYFLCEQVKVAKHRVNIAKLGLDVTSGDSLTGGYLMELDNNKDEPYVYQPTKRFPWNFKDPDEVNTAQLEYMTSYIDDMTNSLYGDLGFKARHFTAYMDLESFADFWIVNEIAMNDEINRPRSFFMHKDINGPFVAGPVWDFDYETYVPRKTTRFWLNNDTTPIFGQLTKDKEFRAIVKRKWQAQKPHFETIPAYIDQLHQQLIESEKINRAMFPYIWSTNEDQDLSYDDAIFRLKKVYSYRIKWLDNEISSW